MSACPQSLTDLDQCHREQQVAMQSELKKEMGLLQKKILMENVCVCIGCLCRRLLQGAPQSVA